jgi:anti-sigma regulatory factor (Ser/Thr protein kinase)
MRAVYQMPFATTAPWPLQTPLELGAFPSAVPCARGHVRTVALEWGLPDLADTAELLASELVTNAVQAYGRLKPADQAAIPVVRVWLVCDRIAMIIHVRDASSELPIRKDIALDEEGGRGLMLVGTLGKEWGTYRKAQGRSSG